MPRSVAAVRRVSESGLARFVRLRQVSITGFDRHAQAAVCVGPQFFQSRQQRRIASLDEKSNRLLSRGFYSLDKSASACSS